MTRPPVLLIVPEEDQPSTEVELTIDPLFLDWWKDHRIQTSDQIKPVTKERYKTGAWLGWAACMVYYGINKQEAVRQAIADEAVRSGWGRKVLCEIIEEQLLFVKFEGRPGEFEVSIDLTEQRTTEVVAYLNAWCNMMPWHSDAPLFVNDGALKVFYRKAEFRFNTWGPAGVQLFLYGYPMI